MRVIGYVMNCEVNDNVLLVNINDKNFDIRVSEEQFKEYESIRDDFNSFLKLMDEKQDAQAKVELEMDGDEFELIKFI